MLIIESSNIDELRLRKLWYKSFNEVRIYVYIFIKEVQVHPSPVQRLHLIRLFLRVLKSVCRESLFYPIVFYNLVLIVYYELVSPSDEFPPP